MRDKVHQITMEEYYWTLQPPKYGDRGCTLCWWYDRKKQCCQWDDIEYFSKTVHTYPSCEHFEPSERCVPGMCASCKYSNRFKYEIKEEYIPRLKNGYSRESADDPLEEPNIYCTHPDGSLNRHTAYKDLEWPGFGVGHWDRQHEWDTCERYKEDKR